MRYKAKKYLADSGRGTGEEKIIVFLIESKTEITSKTNNKVLDIFKKENVNSSVGLYFYRFKKLKGINAFSKIGEVSRKDGIGVRFKRGWHYSKTCGDTYLTREFASDIKLITCNNPMYFVFYEFIPEESYPKIDEKYAFTKHKNYFNRKTRNNERINTNKSIGKNLVWHKEAFTEVLKLKFPDDSLYPF